MEANSIESELRETLDAIYRIVEPTQTVLPHDAQMAICQLVWAAGCGEKSSLFKPDAQGPEGHDEACYYCGKPCNAFAGNPGLWPIPLTHGDEPGRVKWHHISCVSERLARLAEIDAPLHTAKDQT